MPLPHNSDEFFEKKLSVYNRSASAGDVMELPSIYVDSEHTGCDREILEAFYVACRSEGGTADEIHLRGLHAVLARFGGRPAPAPAGAVADSVAVLEREAEAAEQGNLWMAPSELRQAATLLRQQQLRIALLEQRQAAPLAQCCPTPVPVADRPWEREGWCDEQGQCWMGDPGGGGFIPSWRLCRPEDAPNMKVSLPANALPLPAGEVQT